MTRKYILRIGTLVFVLIAQINARRIDDDHELNSNSFEESFIRRYLLEKYLNVKHRDTPTFTETQRKFQDEALKTHNLFRVRHCVQPLVLDDDINVRAQAYAEKLASNDSKLIHSTDRGGRLGENLYAVTRSNPITYPDAEKATRAWYGEVAYYDYNKPGYAKNIAHFSQLVWKDSQRLGIGYAFARQNHKLYVVAMYGPPGNYGFAYSTNVLPANC